MTRAPLPQPDRRQRRHLIAEVVRERGGPEGVAEIFGVSEQTVWMACREHGVRWARRPPRQAEKAFRILADLQNTGDPIADVARRRMVSQQRVSEVLRLARENGIRVRDNGPEAGRKGQR